MISPYYFTPWARVSEFQWHFFFGLLEGEWRLHWLDPSCCSGCWEVSIINITTGTMYIHCKEKKSNNLEIKESNIVGFCHSFHLTIYRNPQVSWSLLIKTVSYISLAGVKFIVFGELKQRRQRHQRERQKSNSLRLAEQQLCMCTTLFCTFLCHQCMTTMWKCLISRFVKDMNTCNNLLFSPNINTVSYNFHSRKIYQHLMNWTRWNKSDKVWSSTNSFFKWHFPK